MSLPHAATRCHTVTTTTNVTCSRLAFFSTQPSLLDCVSQKQPRQRDVLRQTQTTDTGTNTDTVFLDFARMYSIVCTTHDQGAESACVSLRIEQSRSRVHRTAHANDDVPSLYGRIEPSGPRRRRQTDCPAGSSGHRDVVCACGKQVHTHARTHARAGSKPSDARAAGPSSQFTTLHHGAASPSACVPG